MARRIAKGATIWIVLVALFIIGVILAITLSCGGSGGGGGGY
jgi:hypothetical protein